VKILALEVFVLLGMPVGQLPYHIAARVGIAACQSAESGFTINCPLPCGLKAAAQAGGDIITDDVDFSVQWRLHSINR
jgi:hypothetical protein